MSKNKLILFYTYLDNSQKYLEFGCGGSTFQACRKPNIDTIISIESDKDWINTLKKEQTIQHYLENKKLQFRHIEIGTNKSKKTYGYPADNTPRSILKQYPQEVYNIKMNDIDLILIDGRFRVACALRCFSLINKDCVVLFDDFLSRKFYHVILDYYDISKQADDMVILKKKDVDNPSEELIMRYEMDPR